MNKPKLILRIATIGFILNLVWENAQAPWYQGYSSFWQHFSVCFLGTLGDVVIVLLLFAAFAGVYRNWDWIRTLSWKTAVPLVLAGLAIGVIIELFALTTGRWTYTEAMPLVPGLRVGLWPVLQMTILPGLTFFISSKAIKQ